jgi:hypothetical protein
VYVSFCQETENPNRIKMVNFTRADLRGHIPSFITKTAAADNAKLYKTVLQAHLNFAKKKQLLEKFEIKIPDQSK